MENKEKDLEVVGSHNSWSYLKPKYWYQWILYPWAKCQSKTITDQLDSDVRVFDLRVRFDLKNYDSTTYKNYNVINCLQVCHNNTIFDYSYYRLIKDLDTIQSFGNRLHKDYYFRVILDYRNKPKRDKTLKSLFNAFIKATFEGINTDHLKLIHCYSFWDGEYAVDNNAKYNIRYIDDYASESNSIFKYLPPIVYKWFGVCNYNISKNKINCLMRDFV